jgi:hypothetical protein
MLVVSAPVLIRDCLCSGERRGTNSLAPGLWIARDWDFVLNSKNNYVTVATGRTASSFGPASDWKFPSQIRVKQARKFLETQQIRPLSVFRRRTVIRGFNRRYSDSAGYKHDPLPSHKKRKYKVHFSHFRLSTLSLCRSQTEQKRTRAREGAEVSLNHRWTRVLALIEPFAEAT